MYFDTFQAAYHWLLDLVDKQSKVTPTIRNVKSKEAFGIKFVLTRPHDVLLASETRNPGYTFAGYYAKWLLYNKQEDWEKLIDKYPHVAKFREQPTEPEGYTNSYAQRIQDQLPFIIDLLKKDPENRRAVIHILEQQDRVVIGGHTTAEYPCTIAFEFLLRDNKLHMFTIMRSQNVCRTIVYDIYNFTTLMMHIAGKLGASLGEYHHYMVSAHFFDHEQRLVDSILDEYYERVNGTAGEKTKLCGDPSSFTQQNNVGNGTDKV